MLNYIEYLGIPTTIAIWVVALLLAINLIGELLEFKGKVVPEFIKMRKYFARKKQERQTLHDLPEMMKDVKVLLNSVEQHYSADNITMRDKWIEWVNHQATVYDESIALLKEGMDKNNEITLALLIDSKRNQIINFASFVIEEKNPVTREQFNRIFKIYEEYEDIIESNGLTNGEVDIAIRIIRESYEHHMRHHTFVEDVRGYDSHGIE